jgi:predicted O-methyltransferase YrrM
MPGIVFDAIEAYIDRLANRGDAALQAIEEQGRKEDWPIVGPAEGSLLHILAKSIRAKKILELGTAIGYSGTWLARALPPDGELVTVEWDPKTAETARRNFAKTGVAKRVRVEVGSALDVVPRLDGPFDLVFNDIDKTHYLDVLPHCIS